MAGKGDKRRPYDPKKWNDNYDFWKKNEAKKEKCKCCCRKDTCHTKEKGVDSTND